MLDSIPRPRVVLVFELGCGCAFQWARAIEPEDLQDPLIQARAIAESLADDGVQDEITNCGGGHRERGQEAMTLMARIER